MKKLTICIPTYKRPQLVVTLLESVFTQIKKNAMLDKVAVRVSDNDIYLSAEMYVLPLIERYPEIDVKYNKNEINTETYNFINVTDMADSEYVWIIGDDDTLQEGAISRVYFELSHGTDILICNTYHYDKEMIRNLGIVYTLKIEIESRNFYFAKREDSLDYFLNAASKNAIFTFLSNVIFRKSTWSHEYKREQYKKLRGSQAEQVYMHLETILKDTSSIRYINAPLINYRSDNDYNESYSKALSYRHILSVQLEGIQNAILSANPDDELKSILINILLKDINILSFCGHNTTSQENDLIYKLYTQEEISLYHTLDIKIDDILQLYNNGCKIVLFGASFLGERLLNKLHKYNILPEYFSDNNSTKWNNRHCDITIISPDEIVNLQNNNDLLILISSMYASEIYNQLSNKGIKRIKMIDYR